MLAYFIHEAHDDKVYRFWLKIYNDTDSFILLFSKVIVYGTKIAGSQNAFVNPKGHKIHGSLLGNLSDSHHGFGP